MAQRALLFSSDRETSRQLIQALQELELTVEHCPEIFGAVERVTGRVFEVVVADLDNGPEAGFLLKTACDLRLNKDAFRIAVSRGSGSTAAKGIKADLVLTKPIVLEHAKGALLACDRFLTQMQTWIVKCDAPRTPQAAAPSVAGELPSVRPTQSPGETDRPARPAEPSPAPGGAFVETAVASKLPATVLRQSALGAGVRIVPRPDLNDRSRGRVQARQRQSNALLAASISVALLAFVYGLSRPLQRVSIFTRAATTCRHGFEKTYRDALQIRWRQSGQGFKTSDSAAVSETTTAQFSAYDVTAPARVRLIPFHHSSIPEQNPLTNQPVLQAEAHPEHAALPNVSLSVRIPDSIALPQPETDPVGGAPITTPPLLSEVEPVSLSEDLSQQLLVEKVQPKYPEQALKSGVQGDVVLQASIGRDGNIADLKLVRGSLVLGQAAYKAVRQWRYKPCIRNGKAVAALTYVTVHFQLPQESLLSPYSH